MSNQTIMRWRCRRTITDVVRVVVARTTFLVLCASYCLLPGCGNCGGGSGPHRRPEVERALLSLSSLEPGQLVQTEFSGGAAVELLGGQGASYLLRMPADVPQNAYVYFGIRAYRNGEPVGPAHWVPEHTVRSPLPSQSWLFDICFDDRLCGKHGIPSVLVNFCFRARALDPTSFKGSAWRLATPIRSKEWFGGELSISAEDMSVPYFTYRTRAVINEDIPLAAWYVGIAPTGTGPSVSIIENAKKSKVALVFLLRIQEKPP